jgi:hypothetical protein
MNKDEVFEHIRALLRDAQIETVERPYRYADHELVPQVRASLRYLRTVGYDTTAVMDERGDFFPDPTEPAGVLVAYHAAASLLAGDLAQKLADGEMGVVFRSGPDLIDTTAAVRSLEKVSGTYADEFSRLLTVRMARESTDAAQNVFGDQTVYPA